MKTLFFLPLFLIACGTSSGLSIQENTSTEQVFIAGQGNSLPGKCYLKMKKGTETLFTEVICHSKITKRLISEIQADLVRLAYHIDAVEIEKTTLGTTTTEAIKSFQQNNNMAYGGLDWATVNRLKKQL